VIKLIVATRSSKADFDKTWIKRCVGDQLPFIAAYENTRGLPEVYNEAIEAGLKTRPPCRFQIVTHRGGSSGREVTVVMDVGHNPPALQRLLEHAHRVLKCVYGSLAGHG
jgi:folylpolyglutamate synthase/dihydropteroate synthase